MALIQGPILTVSWTLCSGTLYDIYSIDDGGCTDVRDKFLWIEVVETNAPVISHMQYSCHRIILRVSQMARSPLMQQVALAPLEYSIDGGANFSYLTFDGHPGIFNRRQR
ncbi:MAG: hypothetical protein IPP25_13575 [Saprospiraceae bacterium]|nr:hypothetical protein [Candidatus Opimibacter skivensis]